MGGDARICEPGGKGVLLPLIEGEQEWNPGLRGVLYFVGLVYCFLGVGIISDIFMEAIEAVTSRRKRVKLSDDKYITVKVWNDTVANLSLMALGSSAPEILLSCIELIGNEFYSGDLGPSTIVGSAAFNLLVIIAVCVWVIPPGEIRMVEQTTVFAVTATFSVFAYLWMIVILMLSSPDVIEIWEGVLTFLFFWVLILLAYLADRGYLDCGKKKPEEPQARRLSSQEAQRASQLLQTQRNSGVSPGEIALAMASSGDAGKSQTVSRAMRRIEAVREMTAGKRLHAVTTDRDEHAEPEVTINLASSRYDVNSASTSEVKICVIRTGDENCEVDVNYATVDGSCKACQEYLPSQGVLTFLAGETKKDIVVTIVTSTVPRIGTFDLLLENPVLKGGGAHTVTLGSMVHAQISLVACDSPGILSFLFETLDVAGDSKFQNVDVLVVRKDGAAGVGKCKFRTEKGSAVPGHDYIETEGELEFGDCQAEARVSIGIVPKSKFEQDDSFRLILEEPEGISFDPNDDGGEESAILTITIMNSHDSNFALKIMRWFDGVVNFDEIKVGNSDWVEQFTSALYCNGSLEEQREAGASDWAMHMISLPWKLIFAFVPPTAYFGGWLCFCLALVFIGGVTAIIGDMAALFGCVLDIPDAITAITFVALGTSLPDTFASKAAAQQDPYADASVGNVTGSNSVNVFLGLGLPWTIGAAYWSANGQTDKWKEKYGGVESLSGYGSDGLFVVIAGDLGFSVVVFSLCCLICLGTLVIRRRVFGGELGGPHGAKVITSSLFVMLWFYYISLSSWKSVETMNGNDPSAGTQAMALLFGLLIMALLVVVLAFVSKALTGGQSGASSAESDISKEHAALGQMIGDVSMGKVDPKEKPERLSKMRESLSKQMDQLAKWQDALDREEGTLKPQGENVPPSPAPEVHHPPPEPSPPPPAKPPSGKAVPQGLRGATMGRVEAPAPLPPSKAGSQPQNATPPSEAVVHPPPPPPPPPNSGVEPAGEVQEGLRTASEPAPLEESDAPQQIQASPAGGAKAKPKAKGKAKGKAKAKG